MKILIINTNLTDKNGVAGVIFNYLSAMDTSDIRLDVLSINQPAQEYIDIVHKKGGELYVIERLQKKLLSYLIGLYKLIKKNKYSAIHIHGNSHTIVLELLCGYFARCKVRITHSHNTKCEHNFIHRSMFPLFNCLATHKIACGEEAGKWMYGNKSFWVLNNGINTKNFSFDKKKRVNLRKKLKWDDNCLVVGHVGYFYPVKNHEWIIKVFYNLYKNNHKFRLLLIGDGILKVKIIEELKELGIYGVCKITGNISNVSDYLNTMDYIIMPSIYEGLPLTLIEEQANGLQCLVSNNITKEVDKTGNVKFLSLDSPLENWVEVIRKDCENLKERSACSSKAIEDIKKCNYDVIEEAKKLKDYYKKAIGTSA